MARGLERGTGVAVAGAVLLLAPTAPPLEAKAPGVTHCYRSVCHRVRSVEQTRQLIGRTLIVDTSFYDIPGADRFNRGVFTSNGERFNAGDPARVASADFPDGTELLIRNPINGRVSHVRVNDFGPFRANRRLDVTRRVAEDLDFKHKGVVKLEVTVIAPPQDDDLQYRRNRPPRSTAGHLGVVFDAEVPELVARLAAQRATPDQVTAAKVAVAAVAELGTSSDTAAAPAAAPPEPLPLAPVAAIAGMPAADLAILADAAPIALEAAEVRSDRTDLTIASVEAASTDFAASQDLPGTEEIETRLVVADAGLSAGEEISPGLAGVSHTGYASVEVPIDTKAMPGWGDGLAQAGPAQAESETVLVEPLIGPISASLAGTGLGITAASVAQSLPLPQFYLVLVLLLLSSALLALRATATRAPNFSRSTQVRSPVRSHGNTRVIADDAFARVLREERETRSLSPGGDTVKEVAAAPPAPVQAEPQLSVSVIGPGVTIDGTVRTAGRLIVSGVIRGRVEARELVLTRSGSIDGEVFAKTAEITGNLRGVLDADAVTFAAGAAFDGNVIANTIAVDFGAVVEGSLCRRKA